MSNYFRKLPLTAKLMLITLIPIALLVYFAIQIYREKTDKITVLESYQQRVVQSTAISYVIQEMQVERRYSFGYVISRQFRSETVVQRPRTDAAIQKLGSDTLLKGMESYTFLDSLSAIRTRIDNGSITPMEVMSYYTNALFRLNTLNAISGGASRVLGKVQEDVQTQKIVSELISYLGIIRANIYYGLYSEGSSQQVAEGVKGAYDIYNSYVRELEVKGSKEGVAAYRRLEQTTELKPALAYIGSLIRTGSFDTTYTSEDWWRVSAAAVDELRQLQRSMLQRAQEGINERYEKERTSRDRSLFFLALSIALAIFLVVYTITLISRSLGAMSKAAYQLSEGRTGVRIPIETNDVIGDLGMSMRRIDKNNRTLAHAAEAIGSGNFSVQVVPRSEEDMLGNAVARMKEDLQQYQAENEEKLWVHSGTELVNESLRGEKPLKELSGDILDALVSYVGCEIGLLYVCKGEFLSFAAGYAIEKDASVPMTVAMGETLVGQAAQKKKLMHLKNVPEDYIKIRSGSGEKVPASIVLVPLVHNGSLAGVVELGSLDVINPQALYFIQQVAPAIAIALQSAQSRLRLQELLEQTQAQTEELQAQHSELENINAELEAQTEKLQASEEELKVQQEELMQANGELEERSRQLEERNQLIVEKNIDIQRKAEELEVSTRYKSEFLANMSHELRTPLNSVLLLSRLLTENNEKNLTPDQVEYAQVIQSSGQGLLTLIDEILDLSKIEAGKMELEFQPVMVAEVVQDMKGLFAPMAREKGLEFSISTDEKLPSRLVTDKQRLEQVLKNLLSNALKFTSQGSVTLDIRALKENNAFLSFSVKDTGIGIPADKQGLIFEAFQQADGSTRRKFGGTGLGLSISRELTKLLGGEIKVSSEPGKGSEFTIYIPFEPGDQKEKIVEVQRPSQEPRPVVPAPEKKVFRAEKIPVAPADDRSAIGSKDKTILIIEDDIAFAKALLEFTHKRGYKGLVAVRGDEGIALAQQYKPLGILLDIQLPVKDGWEVMEELKANPTTRHIPVHMMSSLEAKKESLFKGAVDFINKPVAFEQMQDVFRRIEEVLTRDPKKVLIVEENQRHAQALAYFLETFNINTQISNNVHASIDELKKEGVDCVILDMGTPDPQAFETLEKVKQHSGMEHLPVIIFTGKNLTANEESKIKQYADSIVIKTAHSYQRILDEVSLFLHVVEEGNGSEKQSSRYRRLGALNEVLSGKKVLVVDDDVRNIFSLTKALEVHNMKVITAVDGKEALTQLEENPDTDVVLMDIMMPEMDGYQAMQAIRGKWAFRDLPVIAITAKAMTGDREKCIQAGASDYISKPVDVDQLLSLLRVWLYDKNM